MKSVKITRESAPDVQDTEHHLYTNDGEYLGKLVFDKGMSRLEYAADQQPHRRYPLKKKYRGS